MRDVDVRIAWIIWKCRYDGGETMKNMKNRRLWALLLAAVFYACNTDSGGPIDISNPESGAPDDPVVTDSALWFSKIYDDLKKRNPSSGKSSTEVYSAVNSAIQTIDSGKNLSSTASTGSNASCQYLLTLIDEANKLFGKETDYGTTSKYATNQIIDNDALTEAVKFIDFIHGTNKSVFVALSPAYGANAAASHDGETWYPVSTGRAGDWRGIAAGDGSFAALSAGTGKRAVYSADGINWEWAAMPFDASWQGITYAEPSGNKRFVAVASYSNKAAYSADGKTWTETAMPQGASWRGAAYGGTTGNEVFAAIATNGSRAAAWSADGIIWNPAELPVERDWSAIAYGGTTGNEKFVAVSLNGGAAYSTDGKTWTANNEANKLPANYKWSAVCYGKPASGTGTFVAVSLDGKAAHSSDGIDWTVDITTSSNKWSAVTYGRETGSGKFVALAAGGKTAAYFKDSDTTWTAGTSNELPFEADWQGLAYGP
jgi:hypothetical protein